jgi:hypothetical protein
MKSSEPVSVFVSSAGLTLGQVDPEAHQVACKSNRQRRLRLATGLWKQYVHLVLCLAVEPIGQRHAEFLDETGRGGNAAGVRNDTIVRLFRGRVA